MSKFSLKFMSGIIGIVGLVGTSRSHAEATEEFKQRQPFFESCRQLADLAAYGWADIERSADISCLDSGNIPPARYDGMVRGFQIECATTVVRKLGTSIDEPGRHDVRMPSQELTLMFIRHYNPLFKEYCSARNPGKGLNTRPAHLTEV